MGGGQGECPAPRSTPRQLPQQGHPQRSPLTWVCACADLIQKDQRAPVSLGTQRLRVWRAPAVTPATMFLAIACRNTSPQTACCNTAPQPHLYACQV